MWRDAYLIFHHLGLLTEYPLWFVLLCLLLGVAYTLFLYFKTDRESLGSWLRATMATLRFLTVFFISFLLLSPLLRQNLITVEKPVIIIGQDNSQSLVLGSDSVYIRGAYKEQLKALVKNLEEKYEVRTYSFGGEVSSPMSSDFSEKVTEISKFFSEITIRYENRNVGAVILASDGIFNYGSDPFYAASNLPYPVYAVGLGDTTHRRDSFINKVLSNPQVFLGDIFPVEIQIDAIHCAGEAVTLTMKEKNRIVGQFDFRLNGNHFSRLVPVMIEAKEPGWHRYTVELTPVEGELFIENNRKEIFVEVMTVRTKIFLVHDAPHPDIGAIREALAGNEKFEVIACTPEEFLLSPDSASLVIFYQVPSKHGIRISESVIAKLQSALFVLGSQSDIPAFNRMNTGLILNMTRVSFSESYPVMNQSFPYFTIDPDLIRLFSQLPPLQSPFGTFQHAPLTEVLAYQRINGATTHFPLISFSHTAEQKHGVIAGENFWRWRVTDYIQTRDNKLFDELIQKIVQYLSVKQDRSYFRIIMKSEYSENEPVEIQAEVYNQSYEMINDPEVAINITDESVNNYPFTFAQTGSAYFLKAGTFSPGIYTYNATVTTGKDHFEKKGSFVVAPVNLEAINLTANHNLLYRIAESHQGKLLRPDEMKLLPELIERNEEIHSISTVQNIYSELINAPWVFLLIIGFLTGEWAFRKYSGL